MSKNKVLVLGCFGFHNNQIDGQTIKTRNIFQLFCGKIGTHFSLVEYFDTLYFKIDKWSIFTLIKQILNCEILLYLPAHNNLKYLFPFIFCITKIMNIKVHYIVIGGWLDEFLNDKPFHRFLLKKVDCIYPENKNLSENLIVKYSFKNIELLPNYRKHSHVAVINKINKTIRLVFLARVDPMKGVDLIFRLAQAIESLGIKHVIIDVYGPIKHEYKEAFFKSEEAFPSVNYLGVLQPSDIYNVLNKYDLMLFPTKYYTEGFPGSILDAYISGIPVIATEWKHSKEFIDNNSTGVITRFGDDNDFIEKVMELINDPHKIYSMKFLASERSKEYSEEKVWSILESRIFQKR